MHIRLFDTWYLDDGQMFCQIEYVDTILHIIDKRLARIGASRARGVNIKIVTRFYGVVDVSNPISDYTRDICKVHNDQDGSFSHVLGINIDAPRGATSPFDNQFGAVAVADKTIELQDQIQIQIQIPIEPARARSARGHGNRVKLLTYPLNG